MQLLLKDKPILNIRDNGACETLDFNLLPFALRKENVTFVDFVEWASNRTLSIGRSYAKEILNALRLPQTNRYAICKACRGLSLEDAYWFREDGEEKSWDEVNLYRNPLSLFITEISLSGTSTNYEIIVPNMKNIHTPELTTLGASAKGWLRHEDGLYLHKVGKYELPASEILDILGIKHIPYQKSTEKEIASYLSGARKVWIGAVGEAIVNSKLFTSEDVSMVTFEEFSIFCHNYGLNPYKEARKMDEDAYLQMQVADYILNNNDRHEQNWGFLMDNMTGKLIGYCPLFDHDHAFSEYEHVMSQTTVHVQSLRDAAVEAQKHLRLDVSKLLEMDTPDFLTEEQWEQVLNRVDALV